MEFVGIESRYRKHLMTFILILPHMPCNALPAAWFRWIRADAEENSRIDLAQRAFGGIVVAGLLFHYKISTINSDALV